MRVSRTTIAQPIFLCLILLAGAASAETLTMGGTGVALALAKNLGDAFAARNPGVTVDVPPSVGSGGGVKALIAGQFGLSFSARPLKDAEKEQGAVSEPLCRTPFVFAVSDRVQGDLSFSGSDVLDVFARRTTEWPDGKPITLVYRPPSETGAALLESRFPGLADLFRTGRETRGAIVAYSDQEMMEIGERNVGSLVFGALSAILAERRQLRTVMLDGVAPSATSLDDGSYPMEFVLHMVFGPNSGTTARQFKDFTRTDEAAAILRRFECAPFTIAQPDRPGAVEPPDKRAGNGPEIAAIPAFR